MAFNIYRRGESGDLIVATRDSIASAAAWVATDGTKGKSYIIKKVEEVDLLVLTPERPWGDDEEDKDW